MTKYSFLYQTIIFTKIHLRLIIRSRYDACFTQIEDVFKTGWCYHPVPEYLYSTVKLLD